MTILGLVSTFRLTISVDWFVPSDTITSNGITLGVLVFGIVIKGVGDVASDILIGNSDRFFQWYDTGYTPSLLAVPSSSMVDSSGTVMSTPASAVGGIVSFMITSEVALCADTSLTIPSYPNIQSENKTIPKNNLSLLLLVISLGKRFNSSIT